MIHPHESSVYVGVNIHELEIAIVYTGSNAFIDRNSLRVRLLSVTPQHSGNPLPAPEIGCKHNSCDSKLRASSMTGTNKLLVYASASTTPAAVFAVSRCGPTTRGMTYEDGENKKAAKGQSSTR